MALSLTRKQSRALCDSVCNSVFKRVWSSSWAIWAWHGDGKRLYTKSTPTKPVFFLLLIGLLTGCQAPVSRETNILESVYSLPVPGSELQLNEALQVRPNFTRVNIQNGEVVDKPDLYTPWCTLHIYRSRAQVDTDTQIESDRFAIASVSKIIDYFAALSITQRVILVADRRPIVNIREDRSNVTFSSVFALKSPTQPAITKMVCSVFADPRWGSHPTLTEIRSTLGNVAQIVVSP